MSTPAVLAASRMDVFSGTVTGRPSMVAFTIFTGGGSGLSLMPAMGSVIDRSSGRARAHRRQHRRHRAIRRDLRLELATELLESRHHGRRARIREHADGLAR